MLGICYSLIRGAIQAVVAPEIMARKYIATLCCRSFAANEKSGQQNHADRFLADRFFADRFIS
jgi:hypothetical protein